MGYGLEDGDRRTLRRRLWQAHGGKPTEAQPDVFGRTRASSRDIGQALQATNAWQEEPEENLPLKTQRIIVDDNFLIDEDQAERLWRTSIIDTWVLQLSFYDGIEIARPILENIFRIADMCINRAESRDHSDFQDFEVISKVILDFYHYEIKVAEQGEIELDPILVLIVGALQKLHEQKNDVAAARTPHSLAKSPPNVKVY